MAKGGRALNSSRLCFVGQGRAGKTALAMALRNKKFEQTVSTIGVAQFFVEVDNKVCLEAGDGDDDQWNELDEGESTIMSQEQAVLGRAADIINLSEEERQLKRQDSSFITDLYSCEENDEPVAESTSTAPVSTRVSLSNIKSFAGHAKDSESRKSANEEPATHQNLPKLKAKKEKVLKHIMELSVSKAGTKQPLRLSFWDYGGQDKFIGMHHLYLSRYCVFLLVFNMKWLLPGASQKDECLEYLTAWLNSILMHAVSGKSQAPILIIGSHKDEVESSEDHDDISKILEDHFKNNRAWQVKYYKKSPGEKGCKRLSFFPVDNTRGQHHEKGPDPVLKQVRRTVLECIGRESYVKRKVPYTWLGAYEALQKETNSCLEFKKVKDICSENEMGTTLELSKETVMMLKFFHQMGLIMYHHETALKHLVVLDPARFLVERASRVVCQHDLVESEGYSPPQERLDLMQILESQKPHQCEDFKKGILHREILREFLWSDVANNRDELELLMTKYQLMVPLTNEDENEKEDRFLVPSLLLPEQQENQVNDHRAESLGLKWKDTGSEQPFTGTKIKNELFAAALEKKVEFKKEEWEKFQVSGLSSDSYIKAGNRYFKPVYARLVGYFIFGHKDIIEDYRKKIRGYVSVDDVKGKGFLPKGLFAAVLGSIVAECERVHGMSFSDMKMTTSSISTAFGLHEFVLRQLPEYKMMELILMVDSPLYVVERLLKLIGEAVSKLMPSLRFAVCTDQVGGACRDGQVKAPTGSLVILDGNGGLEERLRTSTSNECIKVAPNQRLSEDEAREKFGRWLMPLGLRERYHVFLSYRWGNFDTELVKALFSCLCTSVIGEGRQVHVFLDRFRLEDGRKFSSDFAKALINSLGVVPVVSYAALVRMFDLKPDSDIDNVLLEWMLIYELLKRHHLKFCFPIMVGEVKENTKDGKFIESNLFEYIKGTRGYAGECPAHCIGLQWEKVGSQKPETGTEIENGELLAALRQGKVEFRKEEFDAFKATDLSHESYIKVDVTYFKPCKGDCRCKFLPEVVCTKVADRVNELLVENGMQPSELVHQYTVRDVVNLVASYLGLELAKPLTAAPATQAPALDGGSSAHIDTLECAQHAAPLEEKARTTAQAATAIPQQGSKLHLEIDWKKRLYRTAADKVLNCVRKEVKESEKEASQKAKAEEAEAARFEQKTAEQAAVEEGAAARAAGKEKAEKQPLRLEAEQKCMQTQKTAVPRSLGSACCNVC